MGKRRTGKRKSWKGRELKAGDTFMTDAKPTDMIIPIMGPTGAGKSSFINHVLRETRADVGHDLRSHTEKIQHYVYTRSNDERRVVLVDTPGFDDTFVEDAEILRRIAVWLAKSYSDHTKLAGVVYLHDITMRRMFGTVRKNFDMFRKLCGEDALPSIILATTMWDEVSPEMGDRREQQLRETYWKDMLEKGSTIHRFDPRVGSAGAIIDCILGLKRTRDQENYLRIQEELVEIERILPQTEAAQELRYTLKELLAAQKAGEQDKEKIRSVAHQLQELKVPLSKRIAAFFGLG